VLYNGKPQHVEANPLRNRNDKQHG